MAYAVLWVGGMAAFTGQVAAQDFVQTAAVDLTEVVAVPTLDGGSATSGGDSLVEAGEVVGSATPEFEGPSLPEADADSSMSGAERMSTGAEPRKWLRRMRDPVTRRP